MFVITVLLIAICWLLWTIHQDLTEANDRQRNLMMELRQQWTQPDRSPPGRAQQKNAPAEPATGAAPESGTNASTASERKVGINSATKTQLRSLPKVGAIVAERIIAARPFTSIEGLKAVEGVSDKLYTGIAEKVTLD